MMYKPPSKLQDIDFDHEARNRIFSILHKRFGFPEAAWKNLFQQELARRPRHITAESFFMSFGNSYINPVLNSILCRHRLHPTFNNLVLYLLTS